MSVRNLSRMAHALWSGVLNVKKLAIPVGLVATTTGANEVKLKTLHRECATPIGLRPWCTTHERILEPEELVKAAELADGQYLLIEETELETVVPEDSRSIDVFATVYADQLDPLLVDGAYYLQPGKQPTIARPYALLSDALEQTGTVALARFVWKGRERLAAIAPHPSGRVLLLHTLRPAEDLAPAAAGEIHDLLVQADVGEKEADLARELVLRMVTPAAKLELVSGQRRRLRELVAAKLDGREIVKAERATLEQLPIPTADIAGALTESIREVNASRRRPRSKGRKKSPAKT